MILPINVNFVKNNGEQESIDLECALNYFVNSKILPNFAAWFY